MRRHGRTRNHGQSVALGEFAWRPHGSEPGALQECSVLQAQINRSEDRPLAKGHDMSCPY